MGDERNYSTDETVSDDESGSVSRRRFLTVTAVTGVAVGGSSYALAQQTPRFELLGRVGGWEGVAPDDIQGATNPTLTLVAGQNYTLTWENGDGVPHNFNIQNADGDVLVSSDAVETEGQTATVQFTASAEMAEYFCRFHPQSMRGQIEVAESTATATSTPTTETETATETPAETETPGAPTVEGGEFRATLSGRKEVPPVETGASGEAHFTVEQRGDGPNVRYELSVSGPWEGCVTQAHIHVGGPGENGPVVTFLFEAADPVDGASGMLAEGTITADGLIGPLEGEPLSALVEEMTAGNTYVNVHTTAHPSGEIRGQIAEVN